MKLSLDTSNWAIVIIIWIIVWILVAERTQEKKMQNQKNALNFSYLTLNIIIEHVIFIICSRLYYNHVILYNTNAFISARFVFILS